MPKYYVDSGNLRYVCEAENEIEAAEAALDNCVTDKLLGMLIRVNEQGFGDWHDGDFYIETMSLLNIIE